MFRMITTLICSMFGGRGGVVLPCTGYNTVGTCSPIGYGFSGVLVLNRVWFLHCCLGLRMCLEEATFSSLLIKNINKSAS